MTINGNITLNGVTDKDMEMIWGFKARHGAALSFAPNAIQPSSVQGRAAYNNVVFAYTSREGMNIIAEVEISFTSMQMRLRKQSANLHREYLFSQIRNPRQIMPYPSPQFATLEIDITSQKPRREPWLFSGSKSFSWTNLAVTFAE
jgi:hypothetical protein